MPKKMEEYNCGVECKNKAFDKNSKISGHAKTNAIPRDKRMSFFFTFLLRIDYKLIYYAFMETR